MKTSTTRNKGLAVLRTAGVILFWLILWQAACWAAGQELLIASPLQVGRRLLELAVTGDFWLTAGSSLLRILAGFAAALVAGSLLAVLTSASRACDVLLKPALSVVKATPVASFIILALVWLPTGNVPVFISFLMVLPMVWANLSQGIAATDPKLLEMARAFGFSRLKTLRLVYFPSVMPYFMAAFTTGLGFAWKSGVAAEVIGRVRPSIGGKIYNAKIYLETADLFAWTVVVVAMSILIEKLLVRLIARAGTGRQPWQLN